MLLHIGDNITLLKDSNIYEEMICFDIKREMEQITYYFQSVDEYGKMKIERISESILNILNWKESSIPRFFHFENIYDILSIYENISQLNFKGFTASYSSTARNQMKSISLYFKNDNVYLEVICFGCLTSDINEYHHYFKQKSENIPYIYVKETNKVSELHLDDGNKVFYLFGEEVESFEMIDVSCWSGKDYLDKLVVPIHYIPDIRKEINLDGFGLELKMKKNPNVKKDLKGESIIIFGHHNANCLDFFETGIIVDDASSNKLVNSIQFIKELKN